MDWSHESAFWRFKGVPVGNVDGYQEDSGFKGAIGRTGDGGVEIGEIVFRSIARNARRRVC